MDNNRYEEVEKKENIFVRLLKMFCQYLKNLGYDFVVSFKYNNMKLPAILVAIPGVLLGFFLLWHAPVVTQINFEQATIDGVTHFYKNISFNYSGMILFILMLFGILNIFTAVSMSGKKNLGSVVLSTICTSVIVICGILYLYAVFTFFEGYNIYQDAYAKEYASAYAELIANIDPSNAEALAKAAIDADIAAKAACNLTGISTSETVSFDTNFIVSVTSIIVSMVSAVTGCILGFIFYDRTYEKVDR